MGGQRRSGGAPAASIAIAAAFAIATACSSPPRDAADAAPGPRRDGGPPAGDAAPDATVLALPDLTVEVDRLRADLAIERRTFAGDSCELDPVEDCVGAPGDRTLLRFSVQTPNVGTADLVIGAPAVDNPQFEYSTCHGHFHFLGYADYELVDAGGNAVARAQKQAFCLLDSERYLTGDPGTPAQATYSCAFQGIQRGWADVYASRLPCQYIDVTDTPPGSYTLAIEIDAAGQLDELSHDNNRIEIPLTLGDPSLSTPTEPCPADLDARAGSTASRECGWTHAGTFSCPAGESFRAGCAAMCNQIGSCTGDPMLRACDAARPDGNCSSPAAIAADDNACGSQCPLLFSEPCPASGQVAFYHAPVSPGAAYSCALEFTLL